MAENIAILNRKTKLLMDQTHHFCYGSMDILLPNVIKDYYNSISFSISDLKRAESFFKAIQGDNYNESRLRCMISNKDKAPIIFIYEYGGDEQLFIISPRIEDDLALHNSKSVEGKN